ncbi:hypothetical protein F8568_020785 [Actinomadura sp. LD22]|uniref:Uncharacterized protein n=1 Tax=Actinomadura physcomitrii TaxID=2650748 RepID=A0A6I4MFK3_9ACTN|nr:hypothetical protein [Actinomadura physcomitrii]MWA02767.1 hypothetical protein [Actinomadura physcomitrii]
MNRNAHAVPAEPAHPWLIQELCGLIDITAELDANPRDRYAVTQKLIKAAYRVAAATEPVLDRDAALITALREAATARPAASDACPDCRIVEWCGRHAVGLDVADTYNDLGRALYGPVYDQEHSTRTIEEGRAHRP